MVVRLDLVAQPAVVAAKDVGVVEEDQERDTEEGDAKEIGGCLESRCRQCWEDARHGHGADDVDSVNAVVESL